MCGIAGFVEFGGLQREHAAARLRRMTDAIAHRGPDADGYYLDTHAALGHRRLAIIDLSGGQQPMGVLDGRVQIVFNGEIYNYQQLRAELVGLGHVFRTNSDTEAILHAWVQWGEECVGRLHGMFAFAIWDARTESLFLARDRVGKKPLYYCRVGDRVAFASELKALRAADLCPEQVDPESLDCYLTFGYVPAPRTIFRDVWKLRAGHTLRVTRAGQREQRYWRLSFAEPVERTLESAVEELEALLDEAVRCRLMSEVPLGAFLSGGIDSSLVVSSMARTLGRPVITNSVGFTDERFSELHAARAIAQHLGTDHRETIVQPKVDELLPKLAWHLDEPHADSSAVPTWYVCEMTRRNVTVALSGDGGDEAFGGYTARYLPHVFEARVRGVLPAAVRAALFGVLGSLWPASAKLPRPLRLKTIFENLATGDAVAFYRDQIGLRPRMRERLYSQDFVRALHGFTPLEVLAPLYAQADAPDALGRGQFTDVELYMTDDVLVKVDRMSMAHSLEVRCPLLDHRILEFAARLPSRLKVDSRRGKLVLRALASRRLPESITGLPKRGFSMPLAGWLRKELRPVAESLLFDSSRQMAGVLEPGVVRELWQEHLSGHRDHSALVWSLVMLEMWARETRVTPAATAAAA